MKVNEPIGGVSDMAYETDWTFLDDDRRKHVHAWHDPGWANGSAPRATICVVHGLGEHGGRYQTLAPDLVAAGFRVLAFDQQGHGRSQESRGCIASYEALLDDIGAFVAWAKLEFGQPVILLGHSMGGNLVLNYALRRNQFPDGVISSSPMLEAMRKPGWLTYMLLRLLMTVAPNYRLQSTVIAERLMSDPDEQQAFYADDLFHSQLSLRLGAALLRSGAWALSNAERLNVPTLLTHGTEDVLTCPAASEAFACRAGGICQFELLDGYLHDPFRCLDRHEIIALFSEFAQRVAGGNDK